MVFLSRAKIGFLMTLYGILFLAIFNNVLAQELIIVEIQIEGEKANEDFIKIFNSGKKELDISGYKLKKRVSTGKEYSIKVFPTGSKIPAHGYFLWANSQENFHLITNSNVWSTATLAKNNSIALLDREEKILDALAWGNPVNPFCEGEVFLNNPNKYQILKRKSNALGFQDTNNNKEDFYLVEKENVFEKINFEQKPKISLLAPKENPINKEFEVKILISSPKKGIYDLKVAIEKDDKIISEIFNEKEEKWISSHYYLKGFFDGSATEKMVKIRIKEESINSLGEAGIVVRIRENENNKYWEEKEKIFFSAPEINKNFSNKLQANLSFSKNKGRSSSDSLYVLLVALIFSFCAGVFVVGLKQKLKFSKIN